ncbi:MAG: CDP-alcohol phosphatidyltransferase family protein [Alistipes sp.]|nr:CDP-alcohol phosphatidyltransferase family protein [Alistipes sp.]
MKIRLFTIPNMLTLGNLLCGTGAAIALLTQHDYKLAFYLVVASAVCDFFDGFAARLLKQSSPLGVQLDSLADMVSFGVVPAVAMYCLYGDMPQLSGMSESVASVLGFVTLIIAAFSALRLAKFNIDDTQHTEFCGLPTPANGIFCLSVAMLAAAGNFVVPKEIVIAISVVMATMLISPVRMFALKFKGFGWKGNELRYSFIAVSAVLIAAFTKYAAAGIILLYIVISTVRHIVNSAKK